jgi:hypothetical protein
VFTSTFSLFVRLISHQPAVLFCQNKPATSNQHKSAPAISHQPNEQAVYGRSQRKKSSLPAAIKVFLIYMGTRTGIHGVAFLGFVENFSCLVKLFISGPSAK